MSLPLPPDLAAQVAAALTEDIGDGDLTAALVDAGVHVRARVISREAAILCGCAWVDEVFRRLDPGVRLHWRIGDGQPVTAGAALLDLVGPARALLSGERTALNFLQTLSGTATITRRFVEAVAGTGAAIVDTRKTLPGLRSAQKYAVRCGGGVNHRFGLYDAILIKENHIAAAGGIGQAIAAARALGAPVPLMCEAEDLDQARAALAADVDLLLVDDFPLDQLRAAVTLTRAHRARGGRTQLEYSGGVTLDNVRTLAETGVDRISVGALTKHLRAVDLSMRLAPA